MAVVVGTKDRPESLARLYDCLVAQTLKPTVTVVVDASSDQHKSQVVDATNAARDRGLHVLLIDAERPSMTGQRNQAVGYLQANHPLVKFVQVFDDDVMPSAEHLSRCVSFMCDPANADVGAVAGATEVATVRTYRLLRAYLNAFRLLPGRPGSVSFSGRNSAFPPQPSGAKPLQTEWVLGCTMFRIQVYDTDAYWDPPGGYVLYEDVDFSVRVGRRWRLMVLPDLILGHEELSRSRPNYFRTGFQEVAHRHRVVSQLRRPGAKAVYWWSVVGLLALISMRTIRRPNNEPGRLRGAIKGAWAALTNPTYR